MNYIKELPSATRFKFVAKHALIITPCIMVVCLVWMTIYSYLEVRWSPLGRAIAASENTRCLYLDRDLVNAGIREAKLQDLRLEWSVGGGFEWTFRMRGETPESPGQGWSLHATLKEDSLERLRPLETPVDWTAWEPSSYFAYCTLGFGVGLFMWYFLQHRASKKYCQLKRKE